MKLLRSDKKGLTLVEVVAAAVILGIAVISLMGAFISGTIGSAKARHHIQAMNHARAAMEELKNDLSATLEDLKNDVSATLLDGDLPSPTITDYATGIKKVTVTISWTEQSMTGTKPASEKLVTLIRE